MSHIKRALITGSTSGIGLAIAHQLAAEGVDIVLHGLSSEDEGQILVQAFLDQYSVSVSYFKADISDPSQIADLFDRVQKEVGPVSILVNNAGIQFTSPIETFPAEQWDKIIAVNLSSAFHTTQQVIPFMVEQGW